MSNLGDKLDDVEKKLNETLEPIANKWTKGWHMYAMLGALLAFAVLIIFLVT